MDFLTFSEKDMHTRVYSAITTPHLLISITNYGNKINVPGSPYCRGKLELNFDDVEDIGVNSFDQGTARQILDFMNNNINKVNLTIIHCGAGISRSVAVAAALSKIINYVDDSVYSKGIPNMLVYTTLLDTYFMHKNLALAWPRLHYLRLEAMKQYVSTSLQRIYTYKIEKRQKEKE